MKTVAGTPNSRDHTGARAPLLSHATARPQHAGTSFESQAQKGRQAVVKSQHAGTSQRYEPGSLPSRPGPQRLLTIGRFPRVKTEPASVTGRDRSVVADGAWENAGMPDRVEPFV